jgi:hypothetical protein
MAENDGKEYNESAQSPPRYRPYRKLPMKNQYFGDINDYRKYGLLRSIVSCSSLRLLVAWMLTPADGRMDGKFTSYLKDASRWSHYDPTLFLGLKTLLDSACDRGVNLIEQTKLLGKAGYFSAIVPDKAIDRVHWFESLHKAVASYDLVFLDPDNGLEVKSTPYGGKNSAKFLYWREVEALWRSGKSVLIYQHFIREKRIPFIQRMIESLASRTPSSMVEAFITPQVVFLMALQPNHQALLPEVVEYLHKRWPEQIKPSLPGASPSAVPPATA